MLVHFIIEDIIMTSTEPRPITATTIENLAVVVQSNPGAYALLVGAGISSTSGILATWDITTDLCRKLAVCHKIPQGENPRSWFADTFGEEPTYTGVLERMSASGFDRVGTLRRYFEPSSEEDIEYRRKQPTIAHRSIARLVKSGHIRVIVTTNFDRLLETAIQAEGIVPTVIATDDEARRAPAFVHNRCTVFKIHGDYLKDDFRNTSDELASYPETTRTRLHQVLKEYGIIVCGWSGKWDVALREALGQTAPDQFASFYWTHRKPEPSSDAMDLITPRDGKCLRIESADHFFSSLADSVEALERMSDEGAISEDTARERVKLYLPDPHRRIQLHDLIQNATNELRDFAIPLLENQEVSEERLFAQLREVEKMAGPLMAALSAGCFFGEDQHLPLWKGCVETLLDAVPNSWGGGKMFYPALLAFYSCGIGAMAGGKHSIAGSLLNETGRSNYVGGEVKAIDALQPDNVLGAQLQRSTLYRDFGNYSGSFYLFDSSRPNFRDLWAPTKTIVNSELNFSKALDLFEYLLGAAYMFHHEYRQGPPMWAVSRDRYLPEDLPAIGPKTLLLVEQMAEQGLSYEPVESGLFGGELATAIDYFRAYNDSLKMHRTHARYHLPN